MELALGPGFDLSCHEALTVSILVFVELALGLVHSGMERSVFRMFQSLFLWNLPSDATYSPPRYTTYIRFNPCFCGTCPRTSLDPPVGHVPSVFQSLFLWNLPSDLLACHDLAAKFHVSILVFVELALGPLRPENAISISPRFQSLFLWNLPSDVIRAATSFPALWFQSLFLWNLPSDDGGLKMPTTHKNVFQSLFLWNLPSDDASRYAVVC